MTYKKFKENISKFNMLNSNDKIIAAVSGGADSIFMLYNLKSLQDEYNLKIIVAHVNHGIRETATRDEKFVEELSKKLSLEYKVLHINMDEYARENKISSEEAGRFLRYKFFRDLSGKDGKIFLAHNEDDQAETVLFRIIRGTGIDGLCAMDYIDKDLYRPMLSIKRSEIEEYISSRKIEFVQDETNFQDVYSRNKLRLNVIPYIENNFNENFKESLVRLSEISKKNNSYIKNKVFEILEKNYIDNKLNIKEIKDLDEYIISEVVREFLKRELNTLEGISLKNINDIINLIKKSENSNITLPGGFNLVLVYNYLYINKELNLKVDNEEILDYGENDTSFGCIKIQDGMISKSNRFLISIDKDKIKGNLKVRTRLDGDKFMPIGMDKYKKLKNFFIDNKVDRYKRDFVPIITDDEEIIWVVGYRLSNKYIIDENTKNIMHISLEGKDE